MAGVTLRGPALGPDAGLRASLLTQLARTFRQFDAVASVEVTWESSGEVWSLAPYGRLIPVTAFPDADPVPRQGSRQLFAVTGGQIVRAAEGGAGGGSLVVAPGITGAVTGAVRPDAGAAAGVTGDRQAVLLAPLAESSVTPVLTGTGFERPNFDRQGLLWVNDSAGSLWVARADATWQQLDTSAIGEGTIDTFRLAPDGIRIALVVARPSGERVLGLARVDRTGGVAIAGWRELSVSTTPVSPVSVVDVGWRTADSLLALVGENRTTQVLAVAQDGSSIASIGPSSLADPVELAVAPGVPPMVRTSAGEVWRYNSDFRWSQHLTGVSSVFYPG